MVRFAYVECELSIDEFYSLSFYEWTLELFRHDKRKREENERWEGNALLTREFMALMANINRNSKKHPTPFEGKEFIPLSFDKKKEEYVSRQMTPEEVDARIEKLKGKIKNG
jgi:hypothetical protein